MIERLRGRLLSVGEGKVLLEVQGVGFRLQVSTGTASHLPRPPAETTLVVRTLLHRDEAVLLYGFADEEEADLFDRLRAVSGVGPAVALNLLALTGRRLRQGIRERDVKVLQAAPGVGAKLARRLITELAEALPDEDLPVREARPEPDPSAPLRAQLVTAFQNLQFSDRRRIEEVVGTVVRESPDGEPQELFKAALKRLSTRGLE